MGSAGRGTEGQGHGWGARGRAEMVGLSQVPVQVSLRQAGPSPMGPSTGWRGEPAELAGVIADRPAGVAMLSSHPAQCGVIDIFSCTQHDLVPRERWKCA